MPFPSLQVCYRVEWAKFQERERKKEEEEKEKERVAYAQIDWHDFVVVETVDFQPNEQGRSVTPVGRARSLAPSSWESGPSCPRGSGGSRGVGQAVPREQEDPGEASVSSLFPGDFGPPAAPVTRSSTDSIVRGPGWASGGGRETRRPQP